VTGINTEVVVTVMYIVCIFYTTIVSIILTLLENKFYMKKKCSQGGMKAVVWTDTFQVIVLYSSMVAILVKGTFDLGGVGVVWERNAAMNRTDFFK